MGCFYAPDVVSFRLRPGCNEGAFLERFSKRRVVFGLDRAFEGERDGSLSMLYIAHTTPRELPRLVKSLEHNPNVDKVGRVRATRPSYIDA
ncbi:MAG: hypothetical protein ACD_30C00001G0004 [uncultured bacterium]|nr:MAG: hypothetical protein ACD_30C00001G0004 [uncultured bacterium]KKQ15771.1 MAG: hypothetical protein US28_C0010G0004 [Candidatus Daviesbacteria bacterium GW2011_GWA1_36_8]OGE31764.1 MAG: hypothetical protein A3C99_03040 [Candidatus Daviesbacteria bacterium RIFCSPHIGHO2_02_FULL_37_9]